MKKILAGAILALLAVLAHAQTSYALRLDQRNSANTAYNSKFVPPAASDNCLVWMAPSSSGATPACAALGDGLAISGATIDVTIPAGPQGPIGPQGPQGIAGNDGTNGTNGTNGADGLSAYQLAVSNGYTGTDAEWLLSLKGADGAQGPAGPTGATGAQGPMGAQGPVGATGPQGPAGTPAPTFNFGAPASRTLDVSTSYQATDTAKAAIITVTPSCTASLALSAGGTCTLEARVGASTLTCSTGTVAATWTHAISGTLAVDQTVGQAIGAPGDIKLPIGAYFILCATSGTFSIAAAEQTAG